MAIDNASFGWGTMPLHRVQDELNAGTLRRLQINAVAEPCDQSPG